MRRFAVSSVPCGRIPASILLKITLPHKSHNTATEFPTLLEVLPWILHCDTLLFGSNIVYYNIFAAHNEPQMYIASNIMSRICYPFINLRNPPPKACTGKEQ